MKVLVLDGYADGVSTAPMAVAQLESAGHDATVVRLTEAGFDAFMSAEERAAYHDGDNLVTPAQREAVALLPSSARSIRVLMHPDDVGPVTEALGGADFEGSVKIVSDPMITRGGCQVDSEHSRLDATLETRLAALTASVLAAQREGDQAQ